tara:strand:- start:529 stop:1242 length:714 start_codon:yes stop_codon:yes gene_type:complete
MITFREHIDISKYTKKEDSFLGYINNLSPENRVILTRDIADTYPLNMSWNDSYSIHSKFKVYNEPMDLVLGQFIMLEQIITGKTKFETESDNDLALAELLIRPKNQQVFDNENIEKEKENREDILNTPVHEVYSVLGKFLENREFVLFKQFAGVFYETPDEELNEEDSDTDKTSESLFNQQWYWYSVVRMLANEDITKYEDIYMLKMSTVMPEMSFLAQKSKIESAEQRQQQAMRKL